MINTDLTKVSFILCRQSDLFNYTHNPSPLLVVKQKEEVYYTSIKPSCIQEKLSFLKHVFNFLRQIFGYSPLWQKMNMQINPQKEKTEPKTYYVNISKLIRYNPLATKSDKEFRIRFAEGTKPDRFLNPNEYLYNQKKGNEEFVAHSFTNLSRFDRNKTPSRSCLKTTADVPRS